MIFVSRLTPLVVLLALSGCATPEQRAEETANFINANYAPVCERLGYTSGTDAHRNCMVQMFTADQARMQPYYGPWGGPAAVRRR